MHRESQVDDQEISEGIRRRDHEAFRALLERYGPGLFNFLLYRLGNKADAEDAYAEVLMKVWEHAPVYEESGRLKAWLFTIAHRRSLDFLARRRRGSLPLQGDAAWPGRDETIASAEPGPEALAHGEEVRERFMKALAGLPEEQREVFLLREYGGLSFAQIVEALECPLGTALARMRYAVLKLRRELEEFHA